MINGAYIYIHIPFCLKKCNYCDFCSFPVNRYSIKDYINKLSEEIGEGRINYSVSTVKSIYIGGGTPSLLDIRHLERLLKPLLDLNLASDLEFTVEINPATANKKYLKELISLNINRISIGAQAFDDKLLQILGRPHTSGDIITTVTNAQNAGFTNISIDLMYGLPHQTMNLWEDTLKQAVNLNTTHISAYGLKIEPGTPFFQTYTVNHSDIPSDEICEQMFIYTHDKLVSEAFAHYEISNYAKQNHLCQHNLNYWYNKPYLGFGLSAHSFINNIRYENTSSMEEYIDNYSKYKKACIVQQQELIEDGIFLQLRLAEGININEFKRVYNIDFYDKYKHIMDKYKDYFRVNKDYISLNLQGMLLSNIILAEFIELV